MRPKLRRTLSDRRKVFALVALLTIAAVVIVETATLRAAHTQLFRRTDTALLKQVESARKAADVLTPAQMAGLIELPDSVTPDTASIVITKTGRVVYTVPIVEAGEKSLPVIPDRATLRERLDEPFTVAGTGGVRRFRAVAGGLDNGAT